MSDPALHVLVAPELYERRDEFSVSPVTVQMSAPDENGRIEMIFTSASVVERNAFQLGLGVTYEGQALDPLKVTLHYLPGHAPEPGR